MFLYLTAWAFVDERLFHMYACASLISVLDEPYSRGFMQDAKAVDGGEVWGMSEIRI